MNLDEYRALARAAAPDKEDEGDQAIIELLAHGLHSMDRIATALERLASPAEDVIEERPAPPPPPPPQA